MATPANLYGKPAKPGATAVVDKEKMGDGQKETNGTAALYWREIERYNRATSDWYQEGEEIEGVYLDENRAAGSSTRKFCLLWANVEVLKPAVYAKPPAVMCSRRYKDKDVVGRIAAELMERATNTTFDLYHADETFKMVRDDRLLPGRGTAWVRYEAHIESYDDPDGTIDNDSQEVVQHERKAGEKMCIDYVHWKDFGHNVARTWSGEVWLVWRIVYKTEEEMAERFGADVAVGLPYTSKAAGGGTTGSQDDPDNRCKVFEVWDKRRKQVAWLVEGKKGWLECGDPPISFSNFFPTPQPCYATKTSKDLTPKPDYRYYRDQAKEINDLTDKIGNMSQWLVIKGFVPSAPSSVADPVEQMLNDKTNKEMFYSVTSMADWSDKGGINKIIDWFPTEKVAQALDYAVKLRNQLIQDVFQLTGISDILRGQTDPNETLGAQELKAQTGTKRLRNTKDEIARYTRDIAQLVAEGIAELFSPENIAKITGFKYVPTPPPMPVMMGNVSPIRPGMPMSPMAQRPGLPAPMGHNMPPEPMQKPEAQQTFNDEVMALLRDDQMRSFRIDIETDSTIMADENAEKAQRLEFAKTMGIMLEKAALAAKGAPDLLPAMSEMILYVVRGFRAGRSLEDSIESCMEAALKRAQQMAANPPPDPRLAIEQQKLKSQAANDQAGHQLDAQRQQQDAQLTIRGQDIDAQLETRKQNLDAQARMRDTQASANAQARD